MRRLALCAALCAAGSAGAEALLPVTNQAALARSFALPELGAAEVLAPGADEFRFALDWTSEFVQRAATHETITLDGETQRYAWNWRRGLPHGFEVGLQIPFYVINGGVLDGIINNYHQLLGLGDGGRSLAPHDRLLYRFTRNGTELDVEHSATEFGDVELLGGWQAAPGLALRALVKLPSGHAEHLTGGNTGFAAWADYDPFAGSRRWLGFISAGGSDNTPGDVLKGRQNRYVAFAGTGVGYRIWQPFALSAQVYFHSKLYDELSVKPLRRDSLQGAFGGLYDINEHLCLRAGFQEDLVTDSSPDFSIHVSLTAR